MEDSERVSEQCGNHVRQICQATSAAPLPPGTAQVILLFLVAVIAVNNRGGEGRKERGLLLNFRGIFLQ